MKLFEVPTRRVPVRVQLARGSEIEGAFYVPDCGPDGHAATLEQRLNDEHENFLALDAADGGHLLQKSRIAVVHGERVTDVGDRAEEIELGVRVDLVGDVQIQGCLSYAMPEGRERLIDFLNAAPPFIALETASGTSWFNRDLVVRVRDSDHVVAR